MTPLVIPLGGITLLLIFLAIVAAILLIIRLAKSPTKHPGRH